MTLRSSQLKIDDVVKILWQNLPLQDLSEKNSLKELLTKTRTKVMTLFAEKSDCCSLDLITYSLINTIKKEFRKDCLPIIESNFHKINCPYCYNPKKTLICKKKNKSLKKSIIGKTTEDNESTQKFENKVMIIKKLLHNTSSNHPVRLLNQKTIKQIMLKADQGYNFQIEVAKQLAIMFPEELPIIKANLAKDWPIVANTLYIYAKYAKYVDYENFSQIIEQGMWQHINRKD